MRTRRRVWNSCADQMGRGVKDRLPRGDCEVPSRERNRTRTARRAIDLPTNKAEGAGPRSEPRNRTTPNRVHRNGRRGRCL